MQERNNRQDYAAQKPTRSDNLCYADGYYDAVYGRRDKSEMYYHTWGRKAAEDYGMGYANGLRDVE